MDLVIDKLVDNQICKSMLYSYSHFVFGLGKHDLSIIASNWHLTLN